MRKDEQISALMDGELATEALPGLLSELNDDERLRARWQRYHLAGHALRGDLPAPAWPDLAARVSAALDAEPTVLAPTRTAPPRRAARLARPLVGMAVAASVAALAIVGLQSFTASPPAVRFQGVSKEVSVAALGLPSARRLGTHWGLDQPAVESQLNSYLVDHGEYARATNWVGMLPYATVVGYDAYPRR